MTAINSLTLRQIARGLLCIPALIILPVLWILQLILFLPVLALIGVLYQETGENQYDKRPIWKNYNAGDLTFDRVKDVSKIYGCETRNVKYRWNIFTSAMALLYRREKPRKLLTALDFGAGSLRDTYELARLGFKVDAIDLDEDRLRDYANCYDWSSVRYHPKIMAGSLFDLTYSRDYDLILAFDVFEHLHNLEDCISNLWHKLSEQGLLFVSVPNKRALWERVRKFKFGNNRKQKLPLDTSGIPHVQFKSPEEWSDFFRSKGFRILKHDMAIGVLVNDCWYGLYGIPLREILFPIISIISKKYGLNLKVDRLEQLFCPAWLMPRVNVVDEFLKPKLKNRWCWNLFVLKKELIL